MYNYYQLDCGRVSARLQCYKLYLFIFFNFFSILPLVKCRFFTSKIYQCSYRADSGHKRNAGPCNVNETFSASRCASRPYLLRCLVPPPPPRAPLKKTNSIQLAARTTHSMNNQYGGMLWHWLCQTVENLLEILIKNSIFKKWENIT